MKNYNDVIASNTINQQLGETLVSLNNLLADDIPTDYYDIYIMDLLGWISIDDFGNIKFFISHAILSNGVTVEIKSEGTNLERVTFAPNQSFFDQEELANILHGQDNHENL